jgi:hypothetical protein
MPRGGWLCKPAAHHGALTPLVVDWLLRNSATKRWGMNKDDLDWA